MKNQEAVTVEEYLTDRLRVADPEASALTIHSSHLAYLIDRFALQLPASTEEATTLCRAEELYAHHRSGVTTGQGVEITFDLLGRLLADKTLATILPSIDSIPVAPQHISAA